LPPHPDAGFVPYVLVDRVDYADVLPCTAADGAGASLSAAGQPCMAMIRRMARHRPSAGTANPVDAPDEDADSLPDEWEIAMPESE
jgi:hypothetical protein